MALLPIATNRTSTPLSTQRLLFQLNSDQLALQQQFDKLSTGRRVLRISDDPSAAGRAIGIQRSLDRTTQLQRNSVATEAFYQSSDDALSRIDDALIEARGATVVASQNFLSEDERIAHATTIRQTLVSVFTAGNGLFRDHQLLGGILEPGNALEWDGAEVLFQGSEAVGQAKLGGGITSALNVNGPESLGVLTPFLEGESLDAVMNAGTRLVDLKGGKGVTPGVIRISDGSNFQEVDLRQAATIGDIETILDQVVLGSRPLSFTIQNDVVRLEYSDGLAGTLSVSDTQGTVVASELGIDNPDGFQPPPLIGNGLAPQVTLSTDLSELNGGAGLSLGNGIRITRGGKEINIDLSNAQTLGEVLITINRSEADVLAELDQANGRILLKGRRSGVDYSIGENGGTAASQLGIRSATEKTELSDLGRGRGVDLNSSGDDLLITRPDGVQLGIELSGAETVDDVLQLIRNHPDNQDTARVLVDLNQFGNGIQLDAPPGAGSFVVTQPGTSNAGVRLGLIPEGEQEGTGVLTAGFNRIAGIDFLPKDPGGAIDTLLRLEVAVREGDHPEIERLQARLDDDLDRAIRTRGRVGVWNQNLQQLRNASEEQSILLQSQLSDEIDADLATVISDMNNRQIALEASMRIIGQTAQISVLNYL